MSMSRSSITFQPGPERGVVGGAGVVPDPESDLGESCLESCLRGVEGRSIFFLLDCSGLRQECNMRSCCHHVKNIYVTKLEKMDESSKRLNLM